MLRITFGALLFTTYVFCMDGEMTLLNKTPKNAQNLEKDQGTCKECQTWIHRFIKNLDDPREVEVLKMILKRLCRATEYENECKAVVEEIDILIHALEPYLNNTKVICTKLHLCENRRIDLFHKINLWYGGPRDEASGKRKPRVVCDECLFAIEEVKQYVEDPNSMREAREYISKEFCHKLGKYSGRCDLVVEQLLPEFFQELDNMLKKPKALCEQLGMCERSIMLEMYDEMNLYGAFGV